MFIDFGIIDASLLLWSSHPAPSQKSIDFGDGGREFRIGDTACFFVWGISCDDRGEILFAAVTLQALEG